MLRNKSEMGMRNHIIQDFIGRLSFHIVIVYLCLSICLTICLMMHYNRLTLKYLQDLMQMKNQGWEAFEDR
ncbi:hypothetical protein PS2_003374 [Malus domestica]